MTRVVYEDVGFSSVQVYCGVQHLGRNMDLTPGIYFLPVGKKINSENILSVHFQVVAKFQKCDRRQPNSTWPALLPITGSHMLSRFSRMHCMHAVIVA